MQTQDRFSNAALAKWLIPYVLVASLQYQFTKDGLYYSSPFVLMTFRYVFVGIIFYFLGGRKLPLDRDALLVAAFSSASTLPWAVGLNYVSAGDSAILSYTMPIFSIPIALVVIKERVLLRELLGALIGFGGVFIYSMSLSHGSQLLGASLTLVGALFWGAYSVYYRKLRDRAPAPIFATQFLVGSIPCVVGSFFFPKVSPGINLLIDVAYIVLFAGVAMFILWGGLLRRGRVGRITTLAFAVPATTILIDFIRTSIPPSSLAVLGGVVMFLGIFVSNWKRGNSAEAGLPGGRPTAARMSNSALNLIFPLPPSAAAPPKNLETSAQR